MSMFSYAIAPLIRSSFQHFKRFRFSEFIHNAPCFPDQQGISPKLRRVLSPLAERMLDDGIIESPGHNATIKEQSSVLNGYLSMCKTPEERHEVVVSFSLLLKVHRLSQTACENCLYQKKRCICNVVDTVKAKHNLWVFQHHGEFGRSNNTGGLLCLLAGAKRSIRGLREQENELMAHILRNRHSTIILFPTSASTTLDQYMGARSSSLRQTMETRPLTLILLDGTSRQAKNLDRFIPQIIPRIQIGRSRVKSWLDPIRRQTEDHRVCTAQAAAMILRELGDDHASDVIENVVRNMVRLAGEERYLCVQKENRFVDLSLSVPAS